MISHTTSYKCQKGTLGGIMVDKQTFKSELSLIGGPIHSEAKKLSKLLQVSKVMRMPYREFRSPTHT